MAFLIHRAVGERTVLRTVEGDRLRIGRDAGVDLRLDDSAVALDHAVIERRGGGWVLEDHGSVTGTYLGGRPIRNAALSGDDLVEIGGYRLRIQVTHPEDPLFIHVAEAAAEAESHPAMPTPGPLPPPPPVIDYAAAYSLRRKGWTKGALTVALTLVALAAVGALAAGSHRALMPGISSAHARIVGGSVVEAAGPAKESAAATLFDPRARAVAQRGCDACHRPWRGPVALEEGCVTCHRPQATPHAALLEPGPAGGSGAAQPCTRCHPEHRDQDLVRPTDGGACTVCHANLEAVVGDGVTRAARITSFAADHPELVLSLPTVSGGGAATHRLPLDEAEGQDPGTVDFGHRRHRVHENGQSASSAGGMTGDTVRGPEGPVALVCGDCHVADPATGLMQPVSFEQHCQSCHRLSFDAAYPDRQAPHGTPQEVEDFLVGLYSRGGEGGGAGSSLRQRRLGVITGGGRNRLPPGVDRQVADAARTLFASGCDLCHRVDLDAVPLPAVAAAGIPRQWMPGARFSHLDHATVACAGCHTGAAASEKTADVLLPGIAVCRECHGMPPSRTARGGSESGEIASGWGGDLACAQCHGYHRQGPPVSTDVPETADGAFGRRSG